MPKLSREEWGIAFYEVMKIPPPPTEKNLKSVQAKLGGRKEAVEKRLKETTTEEEIAKQILAQKFDKRANAYADYLQRKTEHNRSLWQEAEQEYSEAQERERTAHTTRKQVDQHLATVNGRIEDVQTRIAQKDFDGMDEELAQAVRQEQLADSLKVVQNSIEQYEKAIQEKRSAFEYRPLIPQKEQDKEFEESVASLRTLLADAQKRQEQIALLLEGFDDKPVAVERTGALQEKLDTAKRALGDANEKTKEKRQDVADRTKDLGEKQDALLKAAAGDDALKDKLDALEQARIAQQDATEAVAKTKDALNVAAEQHELYTKRSNEQLSQDGPLETGSLNVLLELLAASANQVSEAKSKLRGEEKALRSAMQRAEATQTELRRAVEQRADQAPVNPALNQALKALQQSEDALRRAQSALDQATQEGDQLKTIVTEAERGLTVAKMLPEAHTAAEDFAKALTGFEDFPIWDKAPELRNKMGDSKFEQLNLAARKLVFQYESLVNNGAGIDELRALYDKIPELWRPPAFREQEQNWVAVGGLMRQEAEDKYSKEAETRLAQVDKKIEAFKSKLETGESIASKLGSVLGGVEKGGKFISGLSAVSEKLSGVKEFSEQAEKVLGLAAKLATVLQAPIKLVESGSQSIATEDPVEAMMLQEEFIESLGTLVEGLVGSVEGADKLKIGGALVEGIAGLLPGIGMAISAKEAMKLMVESASRIQEAIEDANSHDEALQTGHRAEPAIDQFARRDKHLAARAVSGTGVAIIKTAAAGVDLTGVGTVASTAMKGVATGVQGVQAVAEQVIDRTEGQKAEELLRRAQAGDGNARAELFRFHPRYAKGLLAVMASDGDSMALRVLSTHGLTDDMIKRSSPKIIKRYLMKKFGEQDEPPSWDSLKRSFEQGVEWLSSKVQAIDRFFDNLAVRIIAVTDRDPLVNAQANLDKAMLDLTEQEVSTATASLLQLRARRDILAREAKGDQSKDAEAAERAVAEEEKQFATLRGKVSNSLTVVRGIVTSVGQQPQSPLRTKAEQAAKAVIQKHMEMLDQLARVA